MQMRRKRVREKEWMRQLSARGEVGGRWVGGRGEVRGRERRGGRPS